MQSSFGWDIAPSFPSSEIYKPIFIQGLNTASIQYLTFQPHKNTNENWGIEVKTILDVRTTFSGNVRICIKNQTNTILDKLYDVVSTAAKSDGIAEIVINDEIAKDSVNVWWPNEIGEQPLYDLEVSLQGPGNYKPISKKTIKVGFRTLSLEQPKISDVRKYCRLQTFCHKQNFRA